MEASPSPLHPTDVKTWPLVGAPLSRTWSMASTNLTGLLQSFAPQIKAIVPALLAATAGIGLTVLQFVLSLLLAGVLLAQYFQLHRGLALACKPPLRRSVVPEFEQLAGSTIRSVTNGILGVAVIQTVLAGLGFLVGGLPGAGLWTS